jgi:hypothetical protein
MAKKNFLEYFRSLNERERVKVRDEFLQMTGLKYPSWYAKMSSGNFRKMDLIALGMICKEEFVDE